MGSVTSVLDGSGSPEWSYAYEPFGVQRSATRLAASGPDNPLRYAGQFLDATTGLYHMGARQYDAGTGRFTAPDPLGRGAGSAAISGYAYADNQPTVLVDPTGLRPECGSYSQGGHDVAAGVLHAITFGFIRPQDVGTDPSCPAYKVGVVGGLALTAYNPASDALDALAAADGLAEIGAAAEGEALAPSSVRFSQSSVNGAGDIADSMRASGWAGDPIDVVRMPDGGLTAVDNTRVLAAHEAGIDVQANIRGFDEMLPEDYVGRFTTPKGGVPSTWGDAIMNRIGTQNSIYRNTYPFGSPVTGWNGL